VDFRVAMMQLHAHGHTFAALSRQSGVPRDVLSRWWKRYQVAGIGGLQPHSRRPHRSPSRLAATTEAAILVLRQQQLGPARIALHVPASIPTVYRVLVRHGQQQLHPRVPRVVRRYEKSRPGELIHVDFKYLPSLEDRAEFEFAAVDDFSREAVVWIARERTTRSATRFLERVLTALPYRVEAIMTDNDLAFTMRFAHHRERLTRFQQACRSFGIVHRLLRPHAPESNGKVERFIKTIDDECFAVQHPPTCAARTACVDDFVQYYNHRRPHLSLAGLTPVQRRQAYFAQVRLLS
jgi:transposase InsO family protein